MINTIFEWGKRAWDAGKTLYADTKSIRQTIGGFLGVAEDAGLLGNDSAQEPYRVNPAQRVDSRDVMGASQRSTYKAAQIQASNLGLTPRVMEKWQAASNSNIPSIRATLKRTPPILKKGVTIRLS